MERKRREENSAADVGTIAQPLPGTHSCWYSESLNEDSIGSFVGTCIFDVPNIPPVYRTMTGSSYFSIFMFGQKRFDVPGFGQHLLPLPILKRTGTHYVLLSDIVRAQPESTRSMLFNSPCVPCSEREQFRVLHSSFHHLVLKFIPSSASSVPSQNRTCCQVFPCKGNFGNA